MAFSTPFAAPYVNGPPPWHHGGYFDRPFHDDSGYASEDSDSVPPPSLDPDSMYEDNDPFNQYPPWTRRHRAAAFVDAQCSRPVAFRTCHPLHDPCNDSRRTYDLPPPLPFEQQQHRYNSHHDPWLNPTTTSYHREHFGREPTFRRDLRATASPLDIEEHRSRIPDTLPPLNNRVESESESDHFSPSPSSSSSSSSSSMHHHSHSHSPSADLKPKTPQSAQSAYRPSSSPSFSSAPPSPRQHPHQHPHQPRHPTRYYNDNDDEDEEEYLTTTRQQLHRERKELEREKRALEQQRMGRWPCLNSRG